MIYAKTAFMREGITGMCGHSEPNMACGMNLQKKTVEKVSEKQSRLKTLKAVKKDSKNDKKACKNTEKDFKTLKRMRNMAQGRQPKNCAKPPTCSDVRLIPELLRLSAIHY
jgi:hypothetical protein